jgi:hypothetical protein
MTRWTGSLVNRISEGPGQPQPEVGMGATLCCHSDRHAGTVVEIFTVGKAQFVVIQRDHAKRTDNLGMSDSQDYDYTPDPEGPKYTFRLDNKTGRYIGARFKEETKRWVKSDSYGLRLGHRDEHYDFSF